MAAALLAFYGSQLFERRRTKGERAQRISDRQTEFELGLLSEIQALLDELSTLNSENAGRLVGSEDDRGAKLTHMARCSAINERLKLRSVHFGEGGLYNSLDQVATISIDLAGSEDFDRALAANAQLFVAFDMAAAELAGKRRDVLEGQASPIFKRDPLTKR